MKKDDRPRQQQRRSRWVHPRQRTAHHRDLNNANPTENDGQLAKQLRDSVAGDQHQQTNAMPCRQKQEGEGQHIEAGIQGCACRWSSPVALQQGVAGFQQTPDGDLCRMAVASLSPKPRGEIGGCCHEWHEFFPMSQAPEKGSDAAGENQNRKSEAKNQDA